MKIFLRQLKKEIKLLTRINAELQYFVKKC